MKKYKFEKYDYWKYNIVKWHLSSSNWNSLYSTVTTDKITRVRTDKDLAEVFKDFKWTKPKNTDYTWPSTDFTWEVIPMNNIAYTTSASVR